MSLITDYGDYNHGRSNSIQSQATVAQMIPTDLGNEMSNSRIVDDESHHKIMDTDEPYNSLHTKNEVYKDSSGS